MAIVENCKMSPQHTWISHRPRRNSNGSVLWSDAEAAEYKLLFRSYKAVLKHSTNTAFCIWEQIKYTYYKGILCLFILQLFLTCFNNVTFPICSITWTGLKNLNKNINLLSAQYVYIKRIIGCDSEAITNVYCMCVCVRARVRVLEWLQ